MSLPIQQIDQYRWEIPALGQMKVPGRIYASERMMADIRRGKSPDQVSNVAQLPGILSHSIAMPDIHWGYGFPIGGVAAFSEEEGVLSPGGVGYDINCGVRLLRSKLNREEIEEDLEQLSIDIQRAIPSGLGRGSSISLNAQEMDEVLREGAAWAVRKGYGYQADLEVIEERGLMRGADPSKVSARAKKRGMPQLGSLGSGNHFCELGYVDEIFDEEAAAGFGLRKGQITLMLHSGSRGLGYQVCDDSIRMMMEASAKYRIPMPDRQLCAAPLDSPEAAHYFGAMNSAINYAFANRQVMSHFLRRVMDRRYGSKEGRLDLLYDVCHNIAKWEEHEVEGRKRRVCVHRKGATRAFGPGHQQVPEQYREFGQPVLIPGDMGRYSYVLAGNEGAMKESFGSCCHGAGRVLSRSKARKLTQGRSIFQELKDKGIFLRSASKRTVGEEVSEAYKDVADVVDVVQGAGLARKVARLLPLAVIKG